MRVRRYCVSSDFIPSTICSAVQSSASSSIGTTSGGSLMIFRRPSTTVVSFLSTCMLSRLCALAKALRVRLRASVLTSGPTFSSTSSMSRRAYQTSSIFLSVNPIMLCR